jgi:hypothetical protein
MKPTFWKGIVLGSVVSMTMLVATAAFAGTGIGSVLNLGATNRVNARTVLSGSMNGAQLDVENASTGASARGINIHTAANKPPLAVNSTTQVNNLNANLLQGKAATAFVQGNGTVHGARLDVAAATTNAPLIGVGTLGHLGAYCHSGIFGNSGVYYVPTRDQLGQYASSDGSSGYITGQVAIASPNLLQGMTTIQISTASEVATVTVLYGDASSQCHFSVQVVDSHG